MLSSQTRFFEFQFCRFALLVPPSRIWLKINCGNSAVLNLMLIPMSTPQNWSLCRRSMSPNWRVCARVSHWIKKVNYHQSIQKVTLLGVLLDHKKILQFRAPSNWTSKFSRTSFSFFAVEVANYHLSSKKWTKSVWAPKCICQMESTSCLRTIKILEVVWSPKFWCFYLK